jgi:hypothetical protein
MSPQEAGVSLADIGGLEAAFQFKNLVGFSATEAQVEEAFRRDEAAFLVVPPNRGAEVDIALSKASDALFDGSHSFISVSRSVPVEIAPLP